LPLLADVRDESTEDIRLVLEPRSRAVDPQVLMESLFRATELEVRIGLNMNVLDAAGTPRVMNLRETLQAFLDHRHDVLQRVSRHRLAEVARRLEILDGYLLVYLNIDEVIRIIREDDDPKAEMMRRWSLTEAQVEAVLNMRLRALRRLEEIEIRRERDKLTAERSGLEALLGSERRRWKAIAKEISEIKAAFGEATKLGRRRTTVEAAPVVAEVPVEAMVEREPITVLLSEKGWIRAIKGHVADDADVKYKDGDRGRFLVTAETTDRLLVFATNGRFYTLGADKLPRGRGFGEPIRLMIELPNDHEVVTVMVHRPGRTLLVASGEGRGFLVAEEDAVAQTRAGRQVLNVEGGIEARVCVPAIGDHVAVVGDNRKLLVFRLDELPTMARGRGVILQRYKDGGLSDVKVFALADGLTWRIGERTRTEVTLEPWLGARGSAGRLPPNGFPKNQRFG
ncbi:MAG: DNA gyrase subunit A, partial [Alphaproteobacteria bacterium]